MAVIHNDETNPWAVFWVGDSSSAAITGRVAADFSNTNVVRDNLADTSITFTDTSDPTDWAAGKLYEVGGGFYKVGVATSLISTFTGNLSISATYASGTVFSIPNEVIEAERGTDSAATAANLATLDGKVDTIDGIVDDILTDTNTTLPATLSSMDGKLDAIDGVVDDILEDTGTTLPGTLSTISGKVDVVDGIVDLILVDTSTTIPAELSGIESKVDTIDGIVDAILVDTDTTLPDLISTVDTVVDGLASNMTTVLANQSDIENKIDTIDTVVDTLTSNLATLDAVVDNVYVEVQKIPRSGFTYRYTQVDFDTGSRSADVTIGTT